MFPDVITVWNQVSRNHTGGCTYQKTVISGVRCEVVYSKSPKKEGNDNTSSLNLFVFPDVMETDSKYIEPIQFKELGIKDSYFTFDTDTYVGIGEIESDKPSGDFFLIGEIKALKAMGNEIHHFEIKGS